MYAVSHMHAVSPSASSQVHVNVYAGSMQSSQSIHHVPSGIHDCDPPCRRAPCVVCTEVMHDCRCLSPLKLALCSLLSAALCCSLLSALSIQLVRLLARGAFKLISGPLVLEGRALDRLRVLRSATPEHRQPRGAPPAVTTTDIATKLIHEGNTCNVLI